jgi:hypothetical protein
MRAGKRMRFKMQKSFVVKKSVDLSGGYDEKGKTRPNFLIRPGDVIVFDATNGNNLTVYRNETIAIVMKQTPISIETFVKNNWLEEIKKPTVPVVAPAPVVVPAPVVEVKAPVVEPKPVEKPKPQQQQPKKQTPKPEPAKAIATGSTEEDTNKFEDSSI